ncbi:MAG: metallophosphoesterase family protein [Clostridia bacterium]|nr:metallophosphoesterase family protein [Clostridia bacterium]
MYNEPLRFHNGSFKLMQISDIQELARVNPDSLKILTLALEREKPDLAVFTGDQVYGIHPSFRLGDTREKITATIKAILAPLEKAGVPFAVTFGNHDDQCGVSNTAQAAIYAESPLYVGGFYRADDDKGTCRIPLFADNGHVFDLYLIDSNGQTDATGGYLPVDRAQLDWFREERAETAEEDGSPVPAIVFQHIPVPEYYDVLRRVPKGTKGAVEAFRTHKNEFYTLPEEIAAAGGFLRESPATPDDNSGEFDVLKADGNVLALSVGHDHYNSFVAEKDGVKLMYTQGCGFNVYGPGRQRGMRIITLREEDLSRFDTYTVTFDDLTGDPVRHPIQEFVLTHIPSSIEQVKKWIPLAAAGGALAAGAAALLIKSRKS